MSYQNRKDRYLSQKDKRDQAEAWYSLYQKVKEDRERMERDRQRREVKR